jgi:hypothetical protein
MESHSSDWQKNHPTYRPDGDYCLQIRSMVVLILTEIENLEGSAYRYLLIGLTDPPSTGHVLRLFSHSLQSNGE